MNDYTDHSKWMNIRDEETRTAGSSAPACSACASEKGGMADTLDALVLRLYQARQAASEARKVRNAARAAAGDCMHQSYQHEGPCWLGRKEVWCEACAQVLPHYAAYHKAADKAGAALRLVLREGKRMSQNASGQPRLAGKET